jgi:DNA transformation protein
MAVSESYKEYVLDILSDLRPIRSRRMFGGLGIWTLDSDLFFALISDDTLYFKVDESTRPDYTNLGMPQFMNMGYYEVPGEILEDPDELAVWIDKAVDVAARHSPAARKKGK